MQSDPAAWPSLRLVRMPGLSPYTPTLEAMRAFTRARGPETRDEIWLLEHPPVFTLGLAGRRDHLLDPGEIPVVNAERGGQVTYHGPGQVIAYTLVDLHRLGIGPRELVYRMEQAVIQTLAGFGVQGGRVAGAPGVYVQTGATPTTPTAPTTPTTPTAPATPTAPTTPTAPAAPAAPAKRPEPRFDGVAKIAALGVKISRGCSFHGLALNVRMDLDAFGRIDPCGYPGLRTVDLASLGVFVEIDEVAALLGERLTAHLGPDAGPVGSVSR